MSVEATYFIADWPLLSEKFRNAGNSDAYWEMYSESERPWLKERPMEPWHENWSAAGTAYEFHEAVAEHVDPHARQALEHLLGAFGVIQAGKLAEDLCPSSDIFAVTMSPETVIATLAIAQQLELEDMRPLYEKFYGDDSDRWLSNFDEIKEYVEGFRALLQEAATTSSGLVVWIA